MRTLIIGPRLVTSLLLPCACASVVKVAITRERSHQQRWNRIRKPLPGFGRRQERAYDAGELPFPYVDDEGVPTSNDREQRGKHMQVRRYRHVAYVRFYMSARVRLCANVCGASVRSYGTEHVRADGVFGLRGWLVMHTISSHPQ